MSGEAWRSFDIGDDAAADAEKWAQHEERKQARHTKRVCQAGREALRKASDLDRDERRMLDVILTLTWGWDRLDDDVSLPQLGTLYGMGGSAEYRQKEASRLVRALADKHVITYSPGNGRGKVSRVGLPVVIQEAPKGGTDCAEPGTPFTSPANDTTARESSAKGGTNPARKGVPIQRERGYPFTPNSVPPPDKGFTERSSSSSSPDPIDANAEEEECDSVATACRLVAERRLAVRTGKPITNRDRWLNAVAADVRSALVGQDFAGLSPEAIADRVQPRPPTAQPAAFDRRAPPMWTELPDGTVVPAVDRGG